MGKEEEIRSLLLKGYSPSDLVKMGYSKSTVYKVYKELTFRTTQVSPPPWVAYIDPSEPRVPPGGRLPLRVTFENRSGMNMYIHRAGVYVEWMRRGEWQAHNVEGLVMHGGRRQFTFLVDVPPTIPLGEYLLWFGVEAQYLPSSYPLHIEWSIPIVVHVKHPHRGIRVFISHSVRDMRLVTELERHLDNYGFEVVVAEEIPQPGVYLGEKIYNLISRSDIVLVLLTEHGVRSEWVWKEVGWALHMHKPVVPIKERSVPKEHLGPLMHLEWIEFSQHDDPQIIAVNVAEKLNRSLEKQGVSLLQSLINILGLVIVLWAVAHILDSISRGSERGEL